MTPPVLIDDTYELEAELGRGGVGVVYRAVDRKTGRRVALKLLRSGSLSERQRERFSREGILAAALDHPGIVRVHACGEHEGQPYLIQELVPGARTLDELFRERPPEERIALVVEAARAVAYAHDQGVIHRDLKPANLLVDQDGRVRVTDFGLATREDMDHLTRTGELIGTPTHMSPEQFRGGVGAETKATDVWALGVILYQALTDELPFQAATLIELVGQVQAATPSTPRSVAVSTSISPAIEAVCLRALRSSPADRYPDAASFADALERAPLRTRSYTLPIVGAVALLFLVGGGLYLNRPLPTPSLPPPPSPSAAPSTASPTASPAPNPADLAFDQIPAGPPSVRQPRLEAWLRRATADDPDRAAAERELFATPLVRLTATRSSFGVPAFLTNSSFLLCSRARVRLYSIVERDGLAAEIQLEKTVTTPQPAALYVTPTRTDRRVDVLFMGWDPWLIRNRDPTDVLRAETLAPSPDPKRDVRLPFPWSRATRATRADVWAFAEQEQAEQGNLHILRLERGAKSFTVLTALGARLVSKLALSPTGRWLAISVQTADRKAWLIELHDLDRNTRLWRLPIDSKGQFLSFSPAGDQLVLGTSSGQLVVFRQPASGKPPVPVGDLGSTSGGSSGVPAVRAGLFARGGKLLLTLAHRTKLRLAARLRCHDTRSWTELPRARQEDAQLPGGFLALSPDERYLVISNPRGLQLRRFAISAR